MGGFSFTSIKKMDYYDKLIKSTLITIIILFSLLMYSVYRFDVINTRLNKIDNIDLEECDRNWETYKMCETILDEAQFGINGIYYHDLYYCVWSKGRDPKDIQNTDYHEKCHDLVYDYYDHFCK